MLNKISRFWKKHGFEICVGISILFIIILAICRIGKKGTFSTFKSLIAQAGNAQAGNNHTYSIPKRRPPQESRGEVECRRVLESYFNKPFPKERPDILKNAITDNNLELDCYNRELEIAVEYNGIQHYKFVPFFHKNKESFQNQQYRDHIKRDLCQKNNIYLIEVPYTVKIEDIETYLLEKIKNISY